MSSQSSTSIGGAGLVVNASMAVPKEILVKAGVSFLRGEAVRFNTDAIDTMTSESQAYAIACEDYEASDTAVVREFYVGGVFRKDAIVLPSSTLDIDDVDTAFLATGRIFLI